MDKKNLCDLDVAGQKVLVRVDYNVPMDETGKITDDTRICASLETIKYLLEHKAAVILMAHLGRPKGQVNIKYSLAPVAKHLAKLLNMPVAFAGDCIGEEAEKAVQKLKPGKILMLENLRFHKEIKIFFSHCVYYFCFRLQRYSFFPKYRLLNPKIIIKSGK